ncbi:MAG: amidohydrolase family protein [Emcibacteraceae bacterium]|nr:amidohydrolase family protein [Emcibacteraceae bacterium]
MTIDVIIKGGTCVSHMGIERKDIAMRDGIIVAMGDLNEITSKTEIDAQGLHILPGVIDTELHLGESSENECRAAIRGGVTSALIHGDVEGLPIDSAKFLTATNENVSHILKNEFNEGVAGIFVSMSDGIDDDIGLHELLCNAKRRVTVHAEDKEVLTSNYDQVETGNVSSHPLWHNERSTIDATRRILAIARGAGQPIHISHVSTDKELGMIAAYKEIATASLSPHHLFLSAPECYEHFKEYAQIDPPIRSEENRTGLWKGLTSGIVDMISSYHQPISVQDKDVIYPSSKSGAPSIQTMLPALLDQVNSGSISLQTLVDLTSAGPARTYNIAAKGRIAVGYDADFTLVDLNKEWTLDDDDVESGCGWDHYAGASFKGMVVGAMIRGELALWQGSLTGTTVGRALKFTDTFKEYEKE